MIQISKPLSKLLIISFLVLTIVGVFFFLKSPFTNTRKNSRTTLFPNRILWAWERPENFSFADKETGVAFLAQTIELKNNEMTRILRRQPLEIPDGIFVIAVTRIESDKKDTPTLSEEQLNKTIEAVSKTATQRNVKAVQIDFDVSVSEREFYKSLLSGLRKKIPDGMPVSITALASWCMYDNWIKDADIDEAVPMLFRMGVDEQSIVGYLNANNDWREPLCRQSYGISLDEPARTVDGSRRLYVFNPRSWSREDLTKINDKVKR